MSLLTRTRRTAGFLTVALALGALSGCGSTTTRTSQTALTRGELIAKADAICSTASQRLHGITDPRQGADIQATAYTQLSALTPPSEMAGPYQRMLSDIRQSSQLAVQTESDYSAGDTAALEADTMKMRASSADVRSTAQPLGFGVC